MSEGQGENTHTQHAENVGKTPDHTPPAKIGTTDAQTLPLTPLPAIDDTSRADDVREELVELTGDNRDNAAGKVDGGKNSLDEIKEQKQKLASNIEAARVAINALVEFAITHGVDPERLRFVTNAFDEEAFFILPDKMFNQAYKDTKGFTDEQASNIGAITVSSTGDIFMRESTLGKTHYVIHETTHRANFLGRKATSTPKTEVLLADDYLLDVDEEGNLQISEYLKEIFADDEMPDMVGFVKAIARDVDEGFTEWTARKGEELAAQKGTPVPVELADHAYPQHVEVVDSMIGRLVKNLGCDKERAQAIVIEATLTGDLSTIREALEENFRETIEQFFDYPRGRGTIHIDY